MSKPHENGNMIEKSISTSGGLCTYMYIYMYILLSISLEYKLYKDMNICIIYIYIIYICNYMYNLYIHIHIFGSFQPHSSVAHNSPGLPARWTRGVPAAHGRRRRHRRPRRSWEVWVMNREFSGDLWWFTGNSMVMAIWWTPWYMYIYIYPLHILICGINIIGYVMGCNDGCSGIEWGYSWNIGDTKGDQWEQEEFNDGSMGIWMYQK